MKKTGKTKRLIALFAALALTLTALTSCSAVSDAFDFLYDALTNGGVRVLGDFNDLTYEKPDFDAIDNDIDELKSENTITMRLRWKTSRFCATATT